MSTTIPAPQLNWCLFFDFDGTLAHIAEHPDAIEVEHHLVETLTALEARLDGAVAIVSGRPIAQIDRFLAPLKLTAAGKHGLECRLPGGVLSPPVAPVAALARVKQKLADVVAADPRLLLEDKEHTIALHYRKAPDAESLCRAAVTEALAGEQDDLHVLDGKMVLEIKPAHSNKGAAIEQFMADAVFQNRQPLFAGDDVTDEDGFVVVNTMGGISIKVGAECDTSAQYHVRDVNAFLDWLQDLKDGLDTLAEKNGA